MVDEFASTVFGSDFTLEPFNISTYSCLLLLGLVHFLSLSNDSLPIVVVRNRRTLSDGAISAGRP